MYGGREWSGFVLEQLFESFKESRGSALYGTSSAVPSFTGKDSRGQDPFEWTLGEDEPFNLIGKENSDEIIGEGWDLFQDTEQKQHVLLVGFL